MFGKKYSRLKFWIISIVLLIIGSFIKGMERIFVNIDQNISLFFYCFVLLIIITWLNTLANRIRDYGGNPWHSLFALIPLVNMILAFYYGIIQYKKSNSINNNNTSTNTASLSKAVVNQGKEIINEVKSTNVLKDETNNTKIDHLSTSPTNENSMLMTEDEIYEKIMLEIEEDNKIKSTWAKVLSQSDGDKDKAESLYINLRFQLIKAENINQVEIEIEKKKQEEIRENKRKFLLLASDEKVDVFLEQYNVLKKTKIREGYYVIQLNNSPIDMHIKYIDDNWKVENK